MVDTHELRAQMYRHGYSIPKAARVLGLSQNALYTKMKTGKFTVDEAEKLIGLLSINNPATIFFAPGVNQQLTSREESC